MHNQFWEVITLLKLKEKIRGIVKAGTRIPETKCYCCKRVHATVPKGGTMNQTGLWFECDVCESMLLISIPNKKAPNQGG